RRSPRVNAPKDSLPSPFMPRAWSAVALRRERGAGLTDRAAPATHRSIGARETVRWSRARERGRGERMQTCGATARPCVLVAGRGPPGGVRADASCGQSATTVLIEVGGAPPHRGGCLPRPLDQLEDGGAAVADCVVRAFFRTGTGTTCRAEAGLVDPPAGAPR